MIEKAKDFHLRGGNLISIEQYLNGQMQNTVDKLDLEFEFAQPAAEKSKEGITSTNKAVDDLNAYYQTHDHPRGGYGQPLLEKWT